MSRRIPFTAAVIVLVLSGAAALFLAIVRQSAGYTIETHGLKLGARTLAPFLGLWAALFGGLMMGLVIFARAEAENSGKPMEERLRRGAFLLSPLALLGLAPLLATDYLTRGDLRTRLLVLAILVLSAVLYLMIAEKASSAKAWPSSLRTAADRFLRLPLRRRLAALFIAAFLIYAGCTALLVSEGITFSGDEPNYLIATHSLVYDQDLNLANNYAARDYFHFYSEKENPRLRLGIYAREGKKGKDFIFPINLPGISALMMPFYALAQGAGEGFWRTFLIKGSLILWGVLLGLQLYLLARDLWKREGLALGLWALYAFSTPVLFYSIHLYPEVPIAFFSVFIFRMVRAPRTPSVPLLLLLGSLLGAFFWFGLKFNLIFWPLLAVGVFELWPRLRPRAKLAAFIAPALLGLVLFYAAQWSMYGTLSPYAVYQGVISGEEAQAITRSFLDLPFSSRVETFLDYFLDQRDGLFLYAPFWAFALLGLLEMVRRARRILIELLLIASPFVLNYAFFTHRQGFCPPGRVLAPLSWIGIVAIGYFLVHAGNRIFRWLFGLAAAAAFVLAGLLLAHPLFLYQPTTHEATQRAGALFVHLSNIQTFLPPYLPSFLKIDNSSYTPNYVWTGLLVLFAAAYFVFGRRGGDRLGMKFHAGAVILLLGAAGGLAVLHPRPALFPPWTVRYASGGALSFAMMPMGEGVVAKGEGELYLHFAKPYRILFSSRAPLKAVKLVFGSETGVHEARITFFDTFLHAERTERQTKEIIFKPPAFYRKGGFCVYDLGIDLKHLSDETMLGAPYLLKIVPFGK